jgi:hypothetical protein
MPAITHPSQLFCYNDKKRPTHICFVFELTPRVGYLLPTFECTSTSGTLFRVRDYIDGVYICELYVPETMSNEIWYPVPLGMHVGIEFQRKMSLFFHVHLVGFENYSRYHSDNTDEDDCYL